MDLKKLVKRQPNKSGCLFFIVKINYINLLFDRLRIILGKKILFTIRIISEYRDQQPLEIVAGRAWVGLSHPRNLPPVL